MYFRLLWMLILFTFSAHAQFEFNINGLVLSPQGQFKENVDRMGWGASFGAAYNFEETPFSLGLGFGFANYGSESRREILIFPVEVEVTTTNDIFFIHLSGKLQQEFGIFIPYAQGYAGFQNFSTSSEIEDLWNSDDEDDHVAGTEHFSDWTYSVGVGGGVMIKLTDFDAPDDGEISFQQGTLFLDLKVKYLFGGEAEYLKEGSITQGPNNKPLFDTTRSETDLISYHIGVAFYFR
jgi:hypothetical protein